MILTSFLLPTGRPQYVDCIKSWWNDFDEFLIGLDKGSDLEVLLPPEFRGRCRFFYYESEPGNVVKIWNELAKEAKGNILAMIADDCFNQTPNWKEIVKENFPDFETTPMAVYGDDGGQGEKLATFFFMSRELYAKLGYFFHPSFKSWYCDTFLMKLTSALGLLKFLPDFKYEHRHPSNGKAANDALYRISRQNRKQGEALYNDQELFDSEINRLKEILFDTNPQSE